MEDRKATERVKMGERKMEDERWETRKRQEERVKMEDGRSKT